MRAAPLPKLVCGRLLESPLHLATRPTLSGLENAVDESACARLTDALLAVSLGERDGQPLGRSSPAGFRCHASVTAWVALQSRLSS